MTTWTQKPFQSQGVDAAASPRWSSDSSAAPPVDDEVTPTFDVTFRLPADLAKLPVQKVELTVYSLTWQKIAHTFDGTVTPWTASLYAMLRFDGVWSYEFWYQYVVFFKDGVHPDYVSPSITAAGAQEVEISELGVRVLATAGIDFAAVPAIDVSWVSALGPGFVTLSAGNPTRDLFAGRDYEAGAPLLANAEYKVAEGSYVAPLPISAGWNPLPFPFCWRQAAFLPVGLTGANPTVLRIQLQYENHEEGDGWKVASGKRQATLDAGNASLAWTFLAVDPSRAMVRYSGTVIPKSGPQKTIATTEANLTVIPVGDAPGWNSVTVNASQVHWDTWDAVVAALYRKDEAGQESWFGEYRFTAASLPEYWGFLGKEPGYFWRATYYPRQGAPVEHPEQSAFTSLLTLPSEP